MTSTHYKVFSSYHHLIMRYFCCDWSGLLRSTLWRCLKITVHWGAPLTTAYCYVLLKADSKGCDQFEESDGKGKTSVRG